MAAKNADAKKKRKNHAPVFDTSLYSVLCYPFNFTGKLLRYCHKLYILLK